MINDFYTITNQSIDSLSGAFNVALRPDCVVYKGHFPERPVAPGVCSIQMIRECAERVLNTKLSIQLIKQCRFTLLLSPADTPNLLVNVSLQPIGESDGQYTLESKIMHGDSIALSLKGIVATTDIIS